MGPEPVDPEATRSGAAAAAVAIGGVLGAAARYGVAAAVAPSQQGFAWGTLAVNVTGCLLAGVAVGLIDRRGLRMSSLVRPFLVTGFLGGYTTLSAFAVDTDLLVRDHRFLSALAYVVASVMAGVVAAAAGLRWSGGPR